METPAHPRCYPSARRHARIGPVCGTIRRTVVSPPQHTPHGGLRSAAHRPRTHGSSTNGGAGSTGGRTVTEPRSRAVDGRAGRRNTESSGIAVSAEGRRMPSSGSNAADALRPEEPTVGNPFSAGGATAGPRSSTTTRTLGGAQDTHVTTQATRQKEMQLDLIGRKEQNRIRARPQSWK